MGRDDDFSGWYNDVIEQAGLIDKRYPVKGMDIWMPYGLRLRNLFDGFVRDEMERTGHDEVEFPLLIPRSEFDKESDHIKGFGGEVYWVTHGGESELDVPLVLRPTSEAAMYGMFSLWIRSHADLPYKIYQIVNTFRYETKQTRSFIRVREIHFFEAHTAHASLEDAEDQIQEDQAIWANLSERTCLPSIAIRRPDWDKFPGAYYSVAAEVLMPDLRTLQCATFHHYRDNFARPYDVTYEDEAGGHQHVHQTTYGISERLIGAVVGLHGDDKGLILPPDLAPIQVVVVPIVFSGDPTEVLEAARSAAEALRAAGLRVRVDEREETAGFKFNDWELRGVPLRVEIGPRDVKNDAAVLVTRHDRDKAAVAREDLVSEAEAALERVREGLLARATALLEANLHDATTVEDAAELKGLVRVGWCGEEACGLAMEEDTGKKVLGVPEAHEPFDGACLHCGAPTTTPALLARSY